MAIDIKEILKKNRLSVTASREKILNLFLEQTGASRSPEESRNPRLSLRSDFYPRFTRSKG